MSMVQINNIVIRDKIVLLKILGLISEKNIYIFIDLQIQPNFHQIRLKHLAVIFSEIYQWILKFIWK